MRLVHAADLHQGLTGTNGRIDPSTGLNSALVSTSKCWAHVATVALERIRPGDGAVILAGDIFHDRSPSAAALEMFARPLRWLREAGIPVVLLAGNHDRAATANRHSIIEVFDDRPRVFGIVRPEVIEIPGGPRIGCLPSVSRQQLMADRDGMFLEADQALVDGLARVIDAFRTLPGPSAPDVLTLHYGVAGAVLGTEQDIAITGEPMLAPADLEGPWRYVAAGHIHRPQSILGSPTQNHRSGRPLGMFSGSIDRFDFGDEGQDKHALLVFLDGDDGFALEPVPTPARRFVTVDVDADEWGEDPTGAVVRIRGEVPQGKDWAAVAQRELYAAGAEVVKIETTTPRTERPRAATIAAAPGPLEAFDLWADVRGIPEEDRPAVRALAAEIMGEAPR
jgi:exonuclease SbcD